MRRNRKYKKYHTPDVKHGSILLSRFINYVMYDGEKTVAERVVYDALDIVAKETKQEPMEVFEKALENASPMLEVVSKRVGGANYQVPREVRAERKFFLGCKWMIDAARAKKGKSMAARLAEEIVAAFNNEGAAIKKKQNVHKMAEANRAFAHFAR